MNKNLLIFQLFFLSTKFIHAQQIAKPNSLTVTNVPEPTEQLAYEMHPYMEFRSANFLNWDPQDKSMLIRTRFSNVDQIHRVKVPMGSFAFFLYASNKSNITPLFFE